MYKILNQLKSIAPKQTNPLPTKALLNRINEAREKKEKLQHSIDMVKKQIRVLTPGTFRLQSGSQLKEAGLTIPFSYLFKESLQTGMAGKLSCKDYQRCGWDCLFYSDY
jgi:hypothetical protein